jgi:transposase
MPAKRVTVSRAEMRKKEKLGIRLLKKGMRAKAVAQDERIQVHPSTVQRWARKHDIVLTYPYNRHKDRGDLVDVKEIVRLRKKKSKIAGKWKPIFTLSEIAGLCSCSRSYVKQVVAKAKEEGKL